MANGTERPERVLTQAEAAIIARDERKAKLREDLANRTNRIPDRDSWLRDHKVDTGKGPIPTGRF